MTDLQTLAQMASSQIVKCLVLGIAITAVAGAASVLAARKGSGMRFAVWFAALLAIALLFFIAKPIAGGAGVPSTRMHAAEITLRPEWAPYIFGAWTFFAAIGLARVGRGLWRVRSLKQRSTPLEDGLAASITSALPPISRRFSLATSEDLRVPAALGFFRPMIVLPAWAASELSPEELNTVVLHEAAHIQRWDDWTNLLQKVIRALLFFHPAIWWIDSRLSLEREISCDDMVLARSRNARQYAACLVALAEKAHAHRSLALVQAAVSQLKDTAQRIKKILDGRQRDAKPILAPVMAAITAFAVFSLAAAQHTPQLVGFRRPIASPTQIASSKFDYVALVDVPQGKAVAASLTLKNLKNAGAGGTLPMATPRVHRSPTPRLSPNPPLQTAEAQSRLQRGTPAVVNAAMPEKPTFIYFVTQTEQYDEFGNLTVTTSVWRIRVANPQAQTAAFPNKT